MITHDREPARTPASRRRASHGLVGRMRALPLAASVAACGTDPWPAVEPLAVTHAATVETRSALLADGDTALLRPRALRLHEDRLLLADHGGHRIAVLDTSLRLIETFGRRGGGPGELRDPIGVDASGGTLAVAEIGNRRLSVFDLAGRFVRSRRLPASPRALAVGADGRIYVALALPMHHLAVIEPDGIARPFGSRIPEQLGAAAPSTARDGPVGFDLVTLPPGGGIWVFDNQDGRLMEFDRSGRTRRTLALPRPVLTALIGQRDDTRGALRRAGANVRAIPLAKDLSSDRRGRLLLLFTLPRSFALLIDPAARSATPILYPEEPVLADALRGAVAAAFAGDRLYAVGEERLDALTMRRAP